jgi:hypothetical protein
MRRALFTVAGVVAFLAVPRFAAAQDEANAPPPPPEMAPGQQPPYYCPPGQVPSVQAQPYCPPGTYPQFTAPPPVTGRPPPAFAPNQVALTVGGGVSNFVRDRISDNNSLAGAWDVRLTVGTRSYVSFEAAYMGTAMRAFDPFEDRTITTTQVFGAWRLNATRGRFQPFLSAGVGWINLHRFGGVETSPVAATNFAHNENGAVFPFGAGVVTYLGQHATVDLRGSYNIVSAASDFTPNQVRPDMWTAELRLGYAF